jgi:hypothetical protein
MNEFNKYKLTKKDAGFELILTPLGSSLLSLKKFQPLNL